MSSYKDKTYEKLKRLTKNEDTALGALIGTIFSAVIYLILEIWVFR